VEGKSRPKNIIDKYRQVEWRGACPSGPGQSGLSCTKLDMSFREEVFSEFPCIERGLTPLGKEEPKRILL
jgi:hypothetical protein